MLYQGGAGIKISGDEKLESGWVKLWRKTIDSAIIKNPKLCTFWVWCLLKASHTKRKQIVGFQEIEIDPGQFVFGRKKASSELTMSEQTIRTCIKHLKSNQQISIESTSKYSIITICKWDTYQMLDNANQPSTSLQTNQEVTSNQPAGNQQVTTNNNDKNVNKDKNVKNEFDDDPSIDNIPTKRQEVFRLFNNIRVTPTIQDRELLKHEIENGDVNILYDVLKDLDKQNTKIGSFGYVKTCILNWKNKRQQKNPLTMTERIRKTVTEDRLQREKEAQGGSI